jgi:hypothetical protein
MVILIGLGAAASACGSNSPTPSPSTPTEAPMPLVATPRSSTAQTPDVPSGWLRFESDTGNLSFLYDPIWKPTECAPDESPLIVLGDNVCGQIEPSFYVDSVPAAQAPAPPDLRCDSSQPLAGHSEITVDGVSGTREYVDYTTAAYGNCRHPIMHALAYTFFTAGRAYSVMYLYIPSAGPDQSSEVDEMVRTLTFSSS